MALFVERPIEPFPLVSIVLVYVVSAGIYILNDVCDIDIDSVSSRDRPLPSGLIETRKAAVAAVLLLVLGPVLAIPISHEASLLLGVFGALGVAYSVPPVRLRKYFLVPSLIIGIGVALGFLIGATLSRGTSLTGTIVFGALLLVAFNTGPSMTKDLADVEGHQASGIISLPVVVGMERAAKITSVVALSSWIFAFLFLMLFDMKPVVFLAVGACFAFAALVIRKMLSDVNDQDNVILSFRLFALGGLATYASMIVGAFLG
jgi:4-hydroxybenzoate polyprenyltransferase